MKSKEINAHMKAAYVYAELSYCKRRHVGCVLVKDGTIIALGYNGTPPGELNECEDCEGMSKDNVTHAEDNALRKLIRSTESSIGSHLFVTTAPCKPCADKIIAANILHVYYDETYRNSDGIDYLRSKNVSVTQITPK